MNGQDFLEIQNIFCTITTNTTTTTTTTMSTNILTNKINGLKSDGMRFNMRFN